MVSDVGRERDSRTGSRRTNDRVVLYVGWMALGYGWVSCLDWEFF